MKLRLYALALVCFIAAMFGPKSDAPTLLIMCNIFWVGGAIIDAIERSNEESQP